MFFKSMIEMLNRDFNDYGFDKFGPDLIKFYKTEYGKEWKVALQHFLYKKSIENDKKAA